MSTNGGQSWFGSDTLPNNGLGRGDPSTGFDALGNAASSRWGRMQQDLQTVIWYKNRQNAGASWSVSKRGTGPTSGFDKEMIAVDNFSASPYANRFYCGWTEFIGWSDLSHAFVKSNRSTDDGQTLSTSVILRQSGNGTGGEQGAVWPLDPTEKYTFVGRITARDRFQQTESGSPNLPMAAHSLRLRLHLRIKELE
jgi:hypothetical protein